MVVSLLNRRSEVGEARFMLAMANYAGKNSAEEETLLNISTGSNVGQSRDYLSEC